jgi:hypothetical protein
MTVFIFLRYLLVYITLPNKTIMGRKKLEPKDKKQTVSIRIPNDLISHLDDIDNKSKLFEWLLTEHFNKLNNGK